MGFFDFLFGNKKKERERQEQLRLQQEAERKRKAEETRRQVEVRRREEERKRNNSTVSSNAYLAIFSADWCGPSKRFLKDIQAAGIKNYSIINVDKEESLTSKFGIVSVPTTILLDENDNIIKKWVGYDDEDPGQTKFVNFIKNSSYVILPFSDSPLAKAHQSVMTMIEEIVGTDEKPAKVEKQKLSDGSRYTGEARLLQNGNYLPYGFGKKYVSKELELTGNWKDGNINGVCYMNMHDAMVTGHFVDSRPDGWCLSIEGGRGFVFGVFKIDDCVCSLAETVTWMIRDIDLGLKISSKKKQILVGEVSNNKAKGFHFLNNGDLYVGTDSAGLNQTGYFIKFTYDGYIQVGRFENGELVESLTPSEVIKANGVNPGLLSPNINTTKKYF